MPAAPVEQLELFSTEQPATSLEVVVVPDHVVRPTSLLNDAVLEGCLTGAARVIRDFLENRARLQTPSADPVHSESGEFEVIVDDTPVAPPRDPVLGTLEDLVAGLKAGKDLSGLTEDVSRYVLNQENRAELVTNLVMSHDYDRLTQFMKTRSVLEGKLLEAAAGSQLTPTQLMAFLKLIQEESEIILTRVRAGATNVKDVMGLLNRIDITTQEREQALQRKFSNTTPQGREVIRRLAHRLRKLASDDVREDRIED